MLHSVAQVRLAQPVSWGGLWAVHSLQCASSRPAPVRQTSQGAASVSCCRTVSSSACKPTELGCVVCGTEHLVDD